ncbi:hypothetical protein BDV29DRAFT_152818 [Aspergillus leporis]|uniref:S-adenosyl-L-methionine-dependent methyltransferase n=1 Tax=Aspergillus leporis TaxID=41062 RepID=A0A5N5XC44_9EURO|nr:hypothetical protein BDV29DRAFT_152818 [Aspergillus leporis]
MPVDTSGTKPKFPFPDDKDAQATHCALNSLWLEILDGKAFIAPLPQLKKGHKVLHLITRSGAWVGNLYESEHHHTRITALDPTHMQYSDGWKSVHQDLEGDWPFSARQSFHLIHTQSLGGLIADWVGFNQNAFKYLVPGGWLEVRKKNIWFYSDDEGVLGRKVPAVKQWLELTEQAAERFGKRVNVAGMQRELMERAGFVEINGQAFRVPHGEVGAKIPIRNEK